MITNGVFNSYTSGLVVQIFINMILTLSLNVATGFLGELCLGHAGFMAIGAYTTALLTINSGLPVMIMFPLGLIAGMIISGIIGFLVGVPALRLKGDYLAIITLAFGEMISILLRTFKFTGGALGLNGIPRVTSFAYSYWCFIISLVLIITFMFSRHGRAILSIREDEIASEATGVNTFKYKMIAFVMSAMFAGLAGGLFAHFQGNLAPEKFNIITPSILWLWWSSAGFRYPFNQYRQLFYFCPSYCAVSQSSACWSMPYADCPDDFPPRGYVWRKEVTYRVFRRFETQQAK